MRTYGRIVPNVLFPDVKKWVQVNTDSNGYNDMVWLTTLIQVVKLNLGESPFFANYGIPAHPSVVSQVAPDLYLNRIQQQFAQYFLTLIVSKLPNQPDPDVGAPSPTYNISIITTYGAFLSQVVPT
jgi:hypothetical protein